MTDIEVMIKEIKEFQDKPITKDVLEVDAHLVFMCHPDTKKLVRTALIENKIDINREFVHIYESKYYTPGDIYTVTDKKIKRKILRQHGVKLKDQTIVTYDDYYTTYYTTTTNISNATINYTTSSTSTGSMYGWR
jgi:hypothetical protein